MQRQRGFTLIELILVILMLAILAAFALPRFANLGRDARIASVQGAAASIRSASAIAHSTWLAKGSVDGYLEMESSTVILVGGYPQAHVTIGGLGDITDAAGIDSANFTATGVANTVTIHPVGVASTVSCYVRYTQANATGTVAPAIALQTGGC